MNKKILIIGDEKKGNQEANIRAVYRIFEPLLSELGFDVEIYISENNKLCYENSKWITEWCNNKVFENKSLIKTIQSAHCVIGFELIKGQIEFLNQQKVKWINISIAPIRFLNDLCFQIDSNTVDLDKLEKIRNYEIKYMAGTVMMKYPNHILDPDSCIIFGQTKYDSSVFYKDKFKDLLCYKEEISKIISKYKRIYYKPHPFDNIGKNNTVEILDFFNAELIDNNYYEILSSSNVKGVISINSSVRIEATYFNKEVHTLLPTKSSTDFFFLHNTIFNKSFWLNILDNNTIDIKKINLPNNYFRKTFSSWSFISIEDKVIENENKINNLINDFNNNFLEINEKYDENIKILKQLEIDSSEFNKLLYKEIFKIYNKLHSYKVLINNYTNNVLELSNLTKYRYSHLTNIISNMKNIHLTYEKNYLAIRFNLLKLNNKINSYYKFKIFVLMMIKSIYYEQNKESIIKKLLLKTKLKIKYIFKIIKRTN